MPTNYYGDYFQVRLPTVRTITSYTLSAKRYAYAGNTGYPMEWVICGSNDGTTWFVLDTRTNSAYTNYFDWQTYTFTNSTSYQYYRWVITKGLGYFDSNIVVMGILFSDNNGTDYYPPTLASANDQGYQLTNNPGFTNGGGNWYFITQNRPSSPPTSSINSGTPGPYSSSTGLYSGLIYTVTSSLASSPAAPTSLSASAGDQSVSISFTPGSDNGSSITNYKYSIDNGSTYTACSPAVTSSPVVISGLTNGQSYSIKLLAVNSIGDGTPSNTVTATPHSVPDAPTNLSASYNGSGSVSISFTPGSNGGETITNYQYSIDCGSTFSPLNPEDGISPIIISGLTNGQTYCIELKAVNSVGAGIASSSVEYTASGLPAAPTSISWVDLYNGSISVSFTPGSSEGSAITNYQYSIEDGANITVLSPAQASSPITITGLTNRTNYSLILQAINANGPGAESTPLALYYMCFLEGSKILCYDSVAQQEVERPVETLRKGDLVKTTMDGYKAIDTIGTSKIYNPGNSMRSKNRLYRCSKENYPELKEDLVITGCHAILVSELSEQERHDLLDIQGKVYVTEDYYRLIACCDKRAVPYEKEGLFNIWHFALENDNYYFNYGVYANGLKVETASKRMMKEMSGMDLL